MGRPQKAKISLTDSEAPRTAESVWKRANQIPFSMRFPTAVPVEFESLGLGLVPCFLPNWKTGMGPWNLPRNLWNLRTFKPWKPGTLKNLEPLNPWALENLEPWKARTLELEPWNRELWHPGKRWKLGTLQTLELDVQLLWPKSQW